ncbi:MAG: Rho termination protein [Cyanobium sp. CACIAM 14]|nr:MAG: Rho termination protein [Cyanobium sp. CACIAM 14]
MTRPRRFSSFLSQPLRGLGSLARALVGGGSGQPEGAGATQDQPQANRAAAVPAEAGGTTAGASAPAAVEASAPDAATGSAPGGQERTWVAFLPRDPQWAQVRWSIAPEERSRALAEGATQLCVRLADVTGLDGGSTHPHTLQEVVVDSHASEWFLPVPLSGRDYRVELGFRKSGSGGWISLGFSATAHVPAVDSLSVIPPDPFAAFSLPEETAGMPAPPTDLGLRTDLHERLYQRATSQWRRLGRGSEAFHEIDSAAGLHGGAAAWESGAGPWASGRSASGIGGVAPRQRSFWLVADAELIVYGATDPAARLSIGGEEVPLSADGTFRVQVPFRDGQQLYPIEAVAADGEQKRSITMEFQRSTPQADVNTSDEAVPEWF